MVSQTPASGLLSDRVAVVTGGGGGIGAATARLFARHGAQVVIADIDAELAQQTADEITASGGSAFDGGHRRPRRRPGRRIGAIGAGSLWPGGCAGEQRRPLGAPPRQLRRHRPAAVGRALPGQPAPRLPRHPRVPAGDDRPARAARSSTSRPSKGCAATRRIRSMPPSKRRSSTSPAAWRSRWAATACGSTRSAPTSPNRCRCPTRSGCPPRSRRSGRSGFRSDGWGCPRTRPSVILFLASDLSAFVTGHTIPTDGGTGAAGGWFRSSRRTDREWTNRPIAP